ncbi:MAG TPA: carbamoyltransferase C-terminal domain-containing protein [Candidatus Polarisedimenticolia bacterium]|nr:carbamoyltransferase C-terminal domain-containing protein [Candidatus Polarisedimenticolia bacterium]
MYILGISGGVRSGTHDPAAVLYQDGKLIAAVEEERLLRIKHAEGRLPENSVRWCLAQAGISIRDVEAVAYCYATFPGMEKRLKDYFNFKFGHCPPVRLIPHYMAHAASAYRVSGFSDSMIVSADVSGDSVSTFLSYGKGTEIRMVKSIPRPNSLGIFYSMLTQILGFQRDNDEYKVMGLASYGKSEIDLSWLLEFGGGDYRLRTEDYMVPVGSTNPFPSKQEGIYSGKLVERLGPPRLKDEPLQQRHMDLAYSAQKLLEQAMVDLVTWLHEQTGSRNLCVAGGVGLNCVMNQRLLALPFIDSLYIQPAASDAGTAIGSALEVMAEKGIRPEVMEHVYTGPSYSDEEIRKALESYKVPYRHEPDVCRFAAERLAEGAIVAWFQGAMEFGPRALGNRSILADPRDPAMKDRINATIKFREDFRPFAPAVLEEKVKEYFCDGVVSPFMTLTFDVQPEKRDRIASITHVDGTARIQTVSAKTNPRFHRLIAEFEKITGIPLVINTSFNVKGQPIVCTPRDAISTFFMTGMDHLILGDYVLSKRSGAGRADAP